MATPPVDRSLLDHAVQIARDAGTLTLDWFQSTTLAVEHKGDGTPVTAADRAAERLLREAILARYPDDSIIGEEEASQVGTSMRTWTIDPIDGTKAFTHGVGLYCNLVAVDDEHGPAVGVINLPALGETVYAGRGIGCFLNDQPARVSAHASVEAAHISTSSFANWPDELLAQLRTRDAHLRTWGDGYGYALVASGRIDAMVDLEVAVWDVAPMPVIMGEAGGRFTDLGGRKGTTGGSGLASNGLVHDDLLAIVDALPPSQPS